MCISDYIAVSVFNVNILTTFLVFVCTFLLVFYNTRRRHGVPPGPPLFPIIGNLPSLIGDDFFKILRDLRQRYGDIFGLYTGNDLMIFLNGYEAVHDALVKRGSLFVNRPFTNFHKQVMLTPAIVFNNGRVWKEQRTFTMNALQELCYRNGGQNLERIVNIELESIVDAIDEISGTFDIKDILNVSIANVISTIVYKHRFDIGDETCLKLLEDISKGATEFANLTVLVNCLPFLANCPGDPLGIKTNITRQANHIIPLNPYLNAIKETNELTDSAVGLYVNHYKTNIVNGTSDTLTEKQMEHTCCEILAVGSETTSTTLRWIILYLIREQNIQNKLFQSINKEIGKERKPTLKDRAHLPYAEAVILEGMRIAAPAPLAIPHTVSRDLLFRGHLIPENSTVIMNIDSCHKDPSVWNDPEAFLPERFLNSDYTKLLIPKEFIPFSLGQRSCAGESLAKMELFLFLTGLVQKFEFLPSNAESVPSVMGNLGLTWQPSAFKMKVKKR